MTPTPVTASTMATRLAVALALGVIIAITYRVSHGRLARDSRTLVGTLVLLTILLAMVTMVIGDSVARAFGLVGALSIVRFRTVVEDTRDTAFVIFAVVVGMAVGTGLVTIALIGIPAVALAAITLSAWGAGPASLLSSSPIPTAAAAVLSTLTVRVGAGQDHAVISGLVGARATHWSLTGVTTARQGAAIDLIFSVSLRDPAAGPALVAELNTLPGVQSVDFRGTVDDDD